MPRERSRGSAMDELVRHLQRVPPMRWLAERSLEGANLLMFSALMCMNFEKRRTTKAGDTGICEESAVI